MHFHTSSPTHHNAEYHAALHKHVATPHDKRSPLYIPDLWIWHDLYDKQLSYASATIVTRSQTAFNRIQINDEEMKFFQNGKRHHPPDLPHLMLTMKDGVYGAIPRTIVTRSMADQLEMNTTLIKTIQAYESFQPMALRAPPPLKKTVAEPPIETKEPFPPVETVKREEESAPDPIDIDTMMMSDSTDNEEEMEQEKVLPVYAEKPLPVRGSNALSCMTMCMGKGKKDPEDTYHPSEKFKQSTLSLDESGRRTKHESNIEDEPPTIPSFPQESLKSASSPEGFPITPDEPSLTIARNPFYFTSSNCSQESLRCGRENRRPFPSLSSLESIGFRSPSPNSRVSTLQKQLQNLSMGPKTVVLRRLQV